jgi:hypothetical protein
MTHGPGVTSATAVGPAPTDPFVKLGSSLSETRRSVRRPRVSFSGCLLVKNACSWMSPVPSVRTSPGSGMLTNGTIVRHDEPALTDGQRKHRLNVEHHLAVLAEPTGGVVVVLEGKRNQVGDRIL